MSHMLANNDGMQPIEWGWAVQGYTLVPLMMKDSQTACTKLFTEIALQEHNEMWLQETRT